MPQTGPETKYTYFFEKVEQSSGRSRAEASLLAEVFGAPGRYTEEYLRWQYYNNPDGNIVGYNAIDPANDQIAAHYVVQPLRARVQGRILGGALSFNTATHPGHQGRGLFVRIAKMTFELAQAFGYKFIVGIANANSTPGFVRRLGFQLVTPLDALIGFGRPDAPATGVHDFERVWTAESRKWRLNRPQARYWISGGRPYSTTEHAGIRACLSSVGGWDVGPDRLTGNITPLTVWIGIRRSCSWRGVKIAVPARLRPSPLNLIFLPLASDISALSEDGVAFEAIDFDAY